ncbi:MAG: family 43 glycosylhydrolase, partial [Sedimentisphaerales bacterium]|nr:family 43 glycosylhydrolase [Sedimentisphaerales bacterium]
ANPVASVDNYVNPVWPDEFPDPTVIRLPDGTFYAYATGGNLNGKRCNIRILKSNDLVNWQAVGDAVPQLGKYNSISKRNWAPHVTAYNGKYYLYYSTNMDYASEKNEQAMAVAVAVAEHPAGPFITTDQPLVSGPGFEHIDPMLFIDSKTNKKYLYWGSQSRPVHVREMADDLISFMPGSKTIDVLACSGDISYENLLEGPWVIEKFGKYYLFVSGNNCCGMEANYAVMVARSDSPLGPFVKMADELGTPDSICLIRNDRWFAPGHNSVITDMAGDQWLVYHAYDFNKKTTDPDGKEKLAGREMLIDKIIWQDQWPVKISPSVTPMPSPLY